MFDGLKDSLGRFRRDVDEAAEVEEDDETAEEEGAVEEERTSEDEGAAEDERTAEEEGAVGTQGTEEPGDRTVEEPREPETVEEPVESAEDESKVDPEPDPEPGHQPDTGTEQSDASDTGPAETSASEPTDDAAVDPTEATEDEEFETPGFAGRVGSLARGRVVIDEDDIEGPLRELELAMLGNDVEMGVAETVIDRVRTELVGETRKLTHGTGSVAEDALREALLSVVAVGQFDFEERIAAAEKPVVIVFTGVNGVGKTTSIAKLSRYLEDRGYSSVLANGDTYRAGANEQLIEHAAALDRKCITHEQGGDPAAVIYDAVEYAEANDVDVVLGDTAGRLHTDDDLMNQLSKIDRVVDPDLVLFVDEAVAGQDAVNRAEQFNDAAAVDGTILTKADADTSGGAAISIAHVTGKPILFLGTGQGYDDLEAFDPEALVDRLVGGE